MPKILYQQGDTVHSLYTLFDGWLIIFKILDNGKRQILRFLLPGDFFRFQVNGIGSTGGYLYSSLALMDSTLCAFPTTQLRLMMEKQLQLAIRLAEMEMHEYESLSTPPDRYWAQKCTGAHCLSVAGTLPQGAPAEAE